MERNAYIREPNSLHALHRLYNNLPKRPYCSNSKRIGYIKSKDKAISLRYIQMNHPLMLRYITFDLDYSGSAFAWDKKELPPFTYVVINRINAHCHGIYEIDPPVFMGTTSKKTLKLLKRVIKAYKELLDADKAITTQKQLVKNPFHKDWELICNGGLYTLSELAEYIRPDKKRKKKGKTIDPIHPSSRNVTLFNKGRIYAYEIVPECKEFLEFYRKVEDHLTKINTDDIPECFSSPLPQAEIKDISKSITKWVWQRRDYFKRYKYTIGVMGFEKIRNLSPKKYKAEVKRRQGLAGKRTAAIRKENTLKTLIASYLNLITIKEGVTQRMVSENTGCSIRTVKYYWKRIIEGAKRSTQDNSGEGDMVRPGRTSPWGISSPGGYPHPGFLINRGIPHSGYVITGDFPSPHGFPSPGVCHHGYPMGGDT
ncbi:MAG: replication initiation protein [Syntrophorhabdaceae bacterium]|nr:replication initiation protein [Syntrophorhabdaceae bacterium]